MTPDGFTPLSAPPPDPRIEERRLDMIANGTFKGGPPNTDDGALIGARENKEERP